jgi:protein-S-isoprenylcysteine O-methyltransferase Ste14
MQGNEEHSVEGRPEGPRSQLSWRRKAQRYHLVTVVLILALTSWMLLATWEEPWTILRAVGLALFLVAAALVVVARVQLGSSFTARAEARHLVTTGLYSRIQNPIYLFAFIAMVGLLLFLNKPWYCLFFVVVVPVQLARIRRERKVLSETFGERYEQYRRQTWF